ncbi:MAG: spore coat associated protein CotJA [Oscillospiraceae bacterium]|nr:spore coat associated protein CotJA [Oscillospiraceae bacterium]
MYTRRRNNSCCEKKELQNVMQCCYENLSTQESCECGFDNSIDSIFSGNIELAQSYVPWQVMSQVFTPEVGLRMGTIFPELVSTYSPGQSTEEKYYLRATNPIKGGCNDV